MKQLGMLLELRKEETVSAMDTVKKSYGCNSRVQEFRSLEVQEFRSSYLGRPRTSICQRKWAEVQKLQLYIDFLAVEDICNAPKDKDKAEGASQ